jgi:hypothetical protein
MEDMQRSLKVNCTKCGKRQGTCFAFCVMCGAKLIQRGKNAVLFESKEP